MCSVLKFLENGPTIEEVDRKIQSLRDDIRTLEHYRNAHLLIVSRLPPDILSMIFEYLALSEHAIPKDGIRYSYQDWLPVSQVCHHWRNVALDTPRMWGCIYNDTSAQFTSLLLERSKYSPLYLHLGNHLHKEATVQQVLHHFSRLKEIELNCQSKLFQIIAGMKTSVLERLTLGSGGAGIIQARFDPAVDPGTVPPLRYLSLRGCLFDLDVSFFSHLRTLKLETSRIMPSRLSLSVTDVLLALGNMQHLEVLELVQVLRGTEHLNSEKVHLPRLRRILVEAEEQGLMLFAHLSCPGIQSAVAQNRDITHMVEPTALAPIASAFYSIIPAPPDAWKVRVYILPLLRICTAEMHIWPELAAEDVPAPPFRISVLGPPDTFESSQVLVSSLTMGTPHILEFADGDHGFNEGCGYLQPFLQSLEGVSELHVRSVEHLLLILASTPANGAPSSLPSLKHISIVLKGMSYKSLLKLGRMLEARNKVHAGIETLKIRCPVKIMNEKDMEYMKSLVGTLDIAYQDV